MTCSSKAAFVGGISCTLFFLAKSFLLALSMSVHLLVRSYNRITNLSMMHIASFGMSRGAEDSSSSASVSSGSTVQTAHAVFLPCLAKLDTVSHPVRAWNIGSARAFSRPSPAAISCAARYRKLRPVPNASHSSSSGCNSCTTDTASTTTSVSTVRMTIEWCPMSMLGCVRCMQQHLTVSLFMVTWGE